jgi:hypothetical protein
VVVVERDDPTEGGDVDGVVVNEVVCAVLAPGCSWATITPRSALAPVAARMHARVRPRNRALASILASGEWWSFACLMCGGVFLSAPFHKSRPGFLPPQWPL